MAGLCEPGYSRPDDAPLSLQEEEGDAAEDHGAPTTDHSGTYSKLELFLFLSP